MTSGSRRRCAFRPAINALRHVSRCLLLAFAVLAVFGGKALAQDETGYDALIEAARDGGATVIVIEPGSEDVGGADSATPTTFQFGVVLSRVRAAALETLAGSRNFFGDLQMTLSNVSSEASTIDWVIWLVIVVGSALLLGVLASRRFAKWARSSYAGTYHEAPETRAEKLGYLLFRGFLMLMGALIVYLIGMVVVFILADEHGPTVAFGVVAVSVYASVMGLRAVFINVLAPDAPGHRLIAMSDEAAHGLFRAEHYVFLLSGTVFGLCVWLQMIGFPEHPHILMLLATTGVSAIALSAVAIVYRKDVAGAIRAMGGEQPSIVLRLIAALWHVLFVLYFVVAWIVSSARLLLHLPTSYWLVFGPVLVFLGALAAYGFLLLMIDRWFDRPPGTADEVAEEIAPQNRRYIFKPVVENAAKVVVGVAALLIILGLWGVRPLDSESELLWLVDLAIVVGLAWVAYEAAKRWIDAKIAEEDPNADADPTEMDEMGGQGASRLATLLPIFRNVLLASIIAIAGMMALAELGVDVAPLFAGAGVIGIAIGFGAQTLVRDVFSGAFFLVDDAFRKGEYIDIGTVKGTVEKISMRSFQLRHHNGPLHTVPFGEIQQLTNYSRDWVMMKLPLRITYDTDVERVRKLIKKLGQEMLEDPEIGHKFLQPLKSQGVLQMEDSAMIIRVKFMTKPGDQFVVRRHVYTRIRDLFEREGIHFAHREVTVRLADDDDDDTARKLTPKEKEAVGAAIAPIIEEEMAAAGEGAPADDR